MKLHPGKEVTRIETCETSSFIADVAQEVVDLNGLAEIIRIRRGHSNDLEFDLKFDLLVTETFDAGCFGEGILSTLHHAQRHLLNRDNFRVLPRKCEIFAVLVSGEFLEQTAKVDASKISLKLPHSPWSAEYDPRVNPYGSDDLYTVPFDLRSKVTRLTEVNFEDAEEVNEIFEKGRLIPVEFDLLDPELQGWQNPGLGAKIPF